MRMALEARRLGRMARLFAPASLRLLGLTHQRRGDERKARRSFQKALSAAKKLGLGPEVRRGHDALARLQEPRRLTG